MFIVLKHEIIRERDYLIAFIFILLSLCLPSQKVVNGIHLAIFFCLLSLNKLLSIYYSTQSTGQIFLAAFYVGIAGLFYPPALIYLPILTIGIVFLKVFNWRDLFISISGAATPFVFAFAYAHLVNRDISHLADTISSFFTPGLPFFLSQSYTIPEFNWGYVCLGIICLVGVIATFSNVRGITANIKISKVQGCLRVAILIIVCAGLCFPSIQISSLFVLAAIPSSILIASYLSGIKRVKKANFILIVFTTCCLLLQFLL